MSWGNAHMLWGLLGLIVIAFCAWWWRNHRRQALARLGATDKRFYQSQSTAFFAVRQSLWYGGLSLVIIAMAQPRWGEEEQTRAGSGYNIALVIDCSTSMNADDIFPNRSTAARRKALDLINGLPNSKFSLIPFARRAALRCPLTNDANALEQMLADCTPQLFSRANQGTAIGEAVTMAIDSLVGLGDSAQAVIVFSDGDDPDAESVSTAAERAKAEGIPIYGVLVGDPDREVSIEVNGQEQVMAANPATLDELATATKVLRVNYTDDGQDLAQLQQSLTATLQSLPWEDRQRIVQSERYHWPLLPGLLAILLAAVLPHRLSVGRGESRQQGAAA